MYSFMWIMREIGDFFNMFVLVPNKWFCTYKIKLMFKVGHCTSNGQRDSFVPYWLSYDYSDLGAITIVLNEKYINTKFIRVININIEFRGVEITGIHLK